MSEDPAADPNNPNLYSFSGNNPVGRVDPTGESWSDVGRQVHDSLKSFFDTISRLLGGDGTRNGNSGTGGSGSSGGVIDNQLTKAMKKLELTVGTMGISYTGINTTRTGIDSVNYRTITITGKNSEGDTVGSIVLQQFVNNEGATVTVLTTNFNNEVEQYYGIRDSKGEQVAEGAINYDFQGQRNLIAVDGFIKNDTFGALFLCVDQKGVTAGFQGSTLPQGGIRNSNGTYSTTKGKILNEGIYDMYSHHHGSLRGNVWNYDNTISLNEVGTGYQREPVNCYDGKTAIGVNIHSGQRSGRASTACQNIAPHSNWFTIGSNGSLSRHNGFATGNPPGGKDNHHTVTHSEQETYWGTWAAFSDIMVPHTPTEPARNGIFLGSYYLNRL